MELNDDRPYQQTMGHLKSYFYLRIANAMREVVERDTVQEGEHPKMVAKVNIQEALDRLVSCPVCGGRLQVYQGYPLERACITGCGDFTITEVWSDGDVVFEFKMAAPEKLESENTERPPGSE